MTTPAVYERIHVVINPAAGKDEPILNVLNDVFHEYGIDWDVSVTKKYGDAAEQARAAIARGVSLVAGYGGDGTQHELANALAGSGVALGVLPGGTGNGFAHELGLPQKLKEAAQLLCTSSRTRAIDTVRVGEEYFIQRLYTGTEPEQQTSREMKDKYGPLAYFANMFQQVNNPEVLYRLSIDGVVHEIPAMRIYVVNSGQTKSGRSITGALSAPDDGLLEVFAIDAHNIETLKAAAERFLDYDTPIAEHFFWRGREIQIDADPDQAVWMDGEFYGRTPVKVEVLPGAVHVVIPEDWVGPGESLSNKNSGGKMSSLVVVSFDSPDEAASVLESLKGQTKYGNISFDDTAVVSKDLNGKVHVKNNVSHGTMNATGVGALLGLMLGVFLFPVAGILIGAGGGALVARFMKLGVDGEFVKDVSESLKPGTSALFVLVHDANPAVVRAVLEEHKGTVLQTTLSPEAEESLKKALD
jgi:YegS/Rv2252/BmrU family lipid kinase